MNKNYWPAARAAGFALTDEQLQARIDQLVAELGSGGALTTWMQANHYDDAEFRASLRLAAEAAWQRDQVIQSVPNEVEQVRAQQIFASTEAGAQRALNSLNAGAEFENWPGNIARNPAENLAGSRGVICFILKLKKPLSALNPVLILRLFNPPLVIISYWSWNTNKAIR